MLVTTNDLGQLPSLPGFGAAIGGAGGAAAAGAATPKDTSNPSGSIWGGLFSAVGNIIGTIGSSFIMAPVAKYTAKRQTQADQFAATKQAEVAEEQIHAQERVAQLQGGVANFESQQMTQRVAIVGGVAVALGAAWLLTRGSDRKD
jgi:hypothetical protein